MDITQNVFLVVHRQLPGFQHRADITTWVFAICKFVALDYGRTGRFQREIVMDPAQMNTSILIDQGVCGLLTPEASHAVASILDRIPKKLRIVFVLFVAHGLSGDEIARTLKIPEGTVRSRLRLARKALNAIATRATDPTAARSGQRPALQ